MMCVPEDELVIESPVVKEFEITSTGKRKAPSGLTDKELKVIPIYSVNLTHFILN